MKKQLLNIALGLLSMSLSAQDVKCGTMEVLQENIKRDPSLKVKMDLIEKQAQEWIKNNPNSRIKNQAIYSPTTEKKSLEKSSNTLGVTSLCGYDNNLYTTISAPTVLNQSVTPSPNCTYGGEYVRVNNLIAGRIYRISTCGVNNFDTQLTVYTAGGGQAVAHNDDWCGSQSEIYFNPLTSGNYDILIDEYNCLSNSLCASLYVELLYTPRPVITIPVVVHVIHFGEAIGTGRNISTSQILSQIDVLNEDFRRLNANINSTPAAFRGGSDDALVQFCLAAQDEFGNPTTGIERYTGTQSSYTNSQFETTVKPFTIWDRDYYLNLWTWDGSGAYAQFPGGAANTDGVVVRYDNFGRVGNVVSPFDLGKTAVHEIGHWLDLRHIWGDASGCGTDDLVSDTPLQDVNCPFGTCPAFPYTDACSPAYPGVMFYNQMDYSADACLSMFTFGQTGRIDATLFTSRVSLQSSNGCLPSSVGINESSLTGNVSIYPNPSSGIFNIKLNSLLQNNLSISVLNIVGQKIIDVSNIENTAIIDLSSQSNGVYFIQINTGKETYNKKIILNK